MIEWGIISIKRQANIISGILEIEVGLRQAQPAGFDMFNPT